jgi:hypothetical protein
MVGGDHNNTSLFQGLPQCSSIRYGFDRRIPLYAIA